LGKISPEAFPGRQMVPIIASDFSLKSGRKIHNNSAVCIRVAWGSDTWSTGCLFSWEVYVCECFTEQGTRMRVSLKPYWKFERSSRKVSKRCSAFWKDPIETGQVQVEPIKLALSEGHLEDG
jgi:hypothetical protein